MRLISIVRQPNRNKKFKATFEDKDGKTFIRRFGTFSNYVSNPDKTEKDRENYIKRHDVNEDFFDPLTAGALSRWILWGESRNLSDNVKAFKKKFNL